MSVALLLSSSASSESDKTTMALSDVIVFVSLFYCWASSNCDGHASVCVNRQVGALQFWLARHDIYGRYISRKAAELVG